MTMGFWTHLYLEGQKFTKVKMFLLLLSGNFHSRIDDQCECPVPCDSISYNPILSYADFPSNNFIKTSIEQRGLDLTTDSFEEEQESRR